MTKGLIRHRLDVYDVELILGTRKKAWKKIRAEIPGLTKRVDGYAGLTSTATWVPKSGLHEKHLVFWLDVDGHGEDAAALVNTCAHEAVHGARSIFDSVEESKPSSEAEAYLIGWLTEWLWKGCR